MLCQCARESGRAACSTPQNRMPARMAIQQTYAKRSGSARSHRKGFKSDAISSLSGSARKVALNALRALLTQVQVLGLPEVLKRGVTTRPAKRQGRSTCSEDVLQAQLQSARIAGLVRSGDPSEGGGRGTHLRRREPGVVEGIQRLRPELDLFAFADAGVLDESEVHVVAVPAADLGEAQRPGTQVIHQLVCGSGFKTGRVEPAVDRALVGRFHDVGRIPVVEHVTPSQREADL